MASRLTLKLNDEKLTIKKRNSVGFVRTCFFMQVECRKETRLGSGYHDITNEEQELSEILKDLKISQEFLIKIKEAAKRGFWFHYKEFARKEEFAKLGLEAELYCSENISMMI